MHIGRIAELANIKLERGRALVLVGAPVSGKTTFAGIIAATNGYPRPISCGISQLTEKFSPIFNEEPDIVVVEEVLFDAETITLLTPLIANSAINVEARGARSREVHTPFFIITTTVAPMLDNRHFNVVHL